MNKNLKYTIALAIFFLLPFVNCASVQVNSSSDNELKTAQFTTLNKKETFWYGWGKKSYSIKKEFQNKITYLSIKIKVKNNSKEPIRVDFYNTKLKFNEDKFQDSFCVHTETSYPALFELILGLDNVKSKIIQPDDEVVRTNYYITEIGSKPKEMIFLENGNFSHIIE
ncbi:hypothetical protein EHQ68_16715 [Leptospira congkakensis]|uniref:DUF4352 domain-containing protein n=1 Tax=Leptospira congkakensis TaxID=2484932 RepID=A0A4Z1A5C9_9LEPT|nr:hypothetical protein [Leptospira congkakensis]TGL85754.1 hypothetical protein EHQ68_16715 [Leptospira congkakensis]TGL97053.1 hypothetical protein EHQ69_00055 [Leptospira congkakensis]TGL97902.1 hypothetical protein EHQ70_05710 [Leptospira congkakensis]